MVKSWELVKNLAALFGVICSVVLLYNHFLVDKYDLKAMGDRSEFYLPTELSQLVDNHLQYNYSDIWESAGLSLFEGSSQNFQTKVEISNEGDNEINNIMILTNSNPCIYKFKNSNGIWKSGESNSKIPVGNLLANEKIQVMIWHKYIPTKEYSISFPEGSFEIEYSKKFYGFIATIADFFDIMGYGIIFIILIIFSLSKSTFDLIRVS